MLAIPKWGAVMSKRDDSGFDSSIDAIRSSRDNERVQDQLQSASLQEDRRAFDRGDKDRRSAERLAIDTPAKLHSSMRDGFEGRLVDISTTGCSLDMSAGFFSPGDKVWMKMEGLQHWGGVVRWVASDKVGVEFDNPFYPAVLEHLVETSRKIVCSKVS